jgi:FMN-dependent NADH-azoreductase
MRTLLVHFLPRGERSRTRRLLDAFRAEAGNIPVEEVDLARSAPPMLDAESVPLYVRRNYRGESLTDAEQEVLSEADRLTGQLKRADAVVLAFPVFNFSVPAAVKAWMDSVMQKGQTWTNDVSGYRGLLAGRRALILMTAGGFYTGGRAGWDHAAPLARQAFEFMGFSDIRIIRADGLNSDPAGAEEKLRNAENEVHAVVRDWFSAAPTTR